MLETGPRSGDGEGPFAVRQFASEQGGLAKPFTQFSTFSNTVGSFTNTNIQKCASSVKKQTAETQLISFHSLIP